MMATLSHAKDERINYAGINEKVNASSQSSLLGVGGRERHLATVHHAPWTKFPLPLMDGPSVQTRLD